MPSPADLPDAAEPSRAVFPPLSKSVPFLMVLMLAAAVSYMDRQIISLLLDPIRHTLEISDTRVSLLQGLAFGLFYAVFGIPVGFIVDRSNRKLLIVAGMLLWSLATAYCGLAGNFWELFAARAVVAIGEAALYPAAFSLLADLFKPTHRGTAFTAFTSAGAVGIAISFLLGGLILQFVAHVSFPTIPLLADREPWQLAFIFAAVPGLFLAPIMLLMPTVKRNEVVVRTRDESAPTLIGFIKQNRKVVGMLVAAYGFTTIAIYGLLGWMATAYIRTLGVKPSESGYLMGGLFLVGSVVGAPLLGRIADKMLSRGIFDGKMRMLSVCCAGAAIGNILWWTQTNLVASLCVGFFVFLCQMGITTMAPAAVNELVPNELRGRMSAAYLLLNSVIGVSFGPTAVAFVTDQWFKNPADVGHSIAVVAVPCMIIGSVLAWLVRKDFGEIVRKNLSIS